MRADEKLAAFVELEAVILQRHFEIKSIAMYATALSPVIIQPTHASQSGYLGEFSVTMAVGAKNRSKNPKISPINGRGSGYDL